jgi:hypothetical protein
MIRIADRAPYAAVLALALSTATGAAGADSSYAAAAPPEAFVGAAEVVVDEPPCPLPAPTNEWLAAADPQSLGAAPCAEPDGGYVYTNVDLERFALPEPRGSGEPAWLIYDGRGWDYVTRVLDQSYERLDADRYYVLDEMLVRDEIEDPEPAPWTGRLVPAPGIWWGPCWGCYDDRPRHRPRHDRRTWQPGPRLDGRDAVPVRVTPPHDRTPIAAPKPAVGVSGSRSDLRPPSRRSTGGRSLGAGSGSRRSGGASAVPRRSTPPPNRQPAQRPTPAKGQAGGR